ncbi:MAG: hypothetical protein JXR77_19385 [Lentisphaeria bacterium]|nr:hypothetical protein [Lentisphaeria bacterium]
MKRVWIVAACVAAGVVGVLGAIGILAFLSFRGIAPRQELTREEKALLVQIDDLVPYGVVPRQGLHRESFAAKRNVDGSLELEYDYDSESEEDPFSISSEAEICRDERDARECFSGRVTAYRIGFRIGARNSAATLQERADLFGLGEDRFAALIAVQGQTTGNMLVVRQGCTVYSLILSSVYMDEKEQLHALLEPKLAKAGTVTLD